MTTERRIAGVVGLGYVGLPLAVAFCEAGWDVVGVDVDATRVDAIASGRSDIEDISDGRLREALPHLRPTTRFAALARAEAIVVAVPTPLTRNREPDLGALMSATAALAHVLQKDQLVVLESTTYPGTTRERFVPGLEESGLRAGVDFNVGYSPERVDPGRTDYTLRTTPKVVAGYTEECRDRTVELYDSVCDQVMPVSTPDAAELTKLLENVFRTVNIALVNELAMLCDAMGIDVWEVIDAAATKPYGFMRFDPGPGLGGHCLPVDPFYLSWRAREFDRPTEFIELAGEVNQEMPHFCVEQVARVLNEAGRPVRGSRILLLGVAYKPGVRDIRESPALKIIRLLQDRGADLVYHDEHVPSLSSLGLRSVPFEPALVGADCAVVVTAHPGVDFQRVLDEVPIVVDFRGATRHLRARDSAAV